MTHQSQTHRTWSGSAATIAFLVALVFLVLLTMQLPEGTGRPADGAAQQGQPAAAAQ